MKHRFLTWWRLLGSEWSRPTVWARASTGRLYRRPRLERLESRLAPAAHDTLATALPLTFDANDNAQVSGNLADANQVDLYEFQLQAGEEFSWQVQASNPIQLSLLDGSGQQDPTVNYTISGFTASSTGVYYFGVSSPSDTGFPPTTGSGPYTLEATIEAAHDTLGTALPLTLDSNQEAVAAGLLAGPNQVDLYKLQLQAGLELAVQLTSDFFDNGLSSSDLRIFDSSGQEDQAVITPPPTFFAGPVLLFTPATSDVYYLGVSSGGDSSYDPRTTDSGAGGQATGTYTLQVNVLTAHDTLATALPVTLDSNNQANVTGTLVYPSQVNLYQVPLMAGQELVVQVPVSYPQPNLRLFDSSGQQVDAVTTSQGISNPVQVLVYTASTTGEYYLGISSAGDTGYDPQTADSGVGTSTGTYSFQANVLEPQDMEATALPLPFDANNQATGTGTLVYPDQVNLYQVQLQSGQQLTVQAQAATGPNPLSTDLRIFDSSGQEEDVVTANPLNFNGLVFTAPATGIYYLGVSSAGDRGYDPLTSGSGDLGDSVGGYTLQAGIQAAHTTLATALPLILDSNQQAELAGVLAIPNQVDLYQLPLQAGLKLVVQLTSDYYQYEQFLDGSNLRIFDSSGVEEPVLITPQTAFTGSVLLFSPATSGVYYLGVSSVGNSSYDPRTADSGSGGQATGGYTLQVNVLTAHDTLATALPVTLDRNNQGQAAGTLVYPNQVDLYQVLLMAGQEVVVQVASGFQRSNLRLFDSSGQPVDTGTTSQGVSNPVQVLLYTPSTTGDYYAGISSAGNTDYDPQTADSGASGTSTGPYSFQANVLELHDTLATALPLPLAANNQANVTGTLVYPDQVNLYQVQLQSGQQLTVQAQAATGPIPLSSDLRIFDSSGQEKDGVTANQGHVNPLLVFTASATGVYYLGVSSADDTSYDPLTAGSGANGGYVGGYTLQASIQAAHNTLATALPLTLDSSLEAQVTGILTNPNQVDLYMVQLQAGLELAVQLKPDLTFDESLNASDLRLFDSNGQEDQAVITNQGGMDPVLLFTPATSDVYYLGVSSAGDGSYDPRTTDSGTGGQATGTYTLQVNVLTGHDTLATALPMTFDGNNGQAAGTIIYPNQVDLYALTLNAGDEVAANVVAQNAASLVDCLRMFDSSGRQLAFAEDTGDADSSQSFEAPLAGVYYVGVSSAGDVNYDPNSTESGSGGLTSGSYTLTLTRSALLVTANPSNDTLATAQTISGDTVLQGTLLPGTTAYYVFTATTTGSLTAAATPMNATVLLPRLTLYGAAGNRLIQADAVGPGNATANIVQFVQPGTYYLAVSAESDSGSAPGNRTYVLDATFAAAQPLVQPLSNVTIIMDDLLTGDFTHDGNLDFVTQSQEGLSVSLGRGDGTFQPAVSYPTFFNLGSNVLAGDFNGDGNLDLVGGVGLSIGVALGRGDGTFLPPVTSASVVGEETPLLAVGDFNGDGKLDLLVSGSPASLNGDTVSVLLGRGDGTFLPATTYAVEGYPSSVAVGDFNNDGNLDIVTVNYYGNTVSVLLGRGDGTFLPAATYAVGISPRSVAVGDFTHDGNLDIVTGNSDGTISVLLGRGDGTFLPAVTYAVGNDLVDVVAVADLSRDGNLDIVTTNGLGTVSVLLGRGDGTFLPAATYVVGNNSVSVAVGDFNNDGILDIACEQDNNGPVLSVLLGRGDGTFVQTPDYAVGSIPTSVAVGDFNHDGIPDLVIANSAANPDTGTHGPGAVSVLLGRGDGTFLPAVTYAVGGDPDSVAVGDFNGDGNLDIVTANRADNTVSVLLGRGDGTFLPAATYAVGLGPESVAVGDFTGDGNLDIVTANNGDGTVSVLLGRGDGTFLPAVTYAVEGYPSSVAVGDFNNDGNLDIVTVNVTVNVMAVNAAFSGTVSVLLGRGDGTFLPATSYTFLPGTAYTQAYLPGAIAVGDFNNDGNLDIVITNTWNNAVSAGNTVSVLLGRGNGTFLPAANYTVGYEPYAVAVGDFNNDAKLDIATVNESLGGTSPGNTVSVLMGRGDGTFLPAGTYTVGTFPDAVAVGDFNRDGNLDLVTANADDNTVSVLLGQGDGSFTASTPANGVALQNVPYLDDLTGARDSNGNPFPDSLILNNAGDLLFRRGLPGNDYEFAPPQIINPGQPARADTIFQTGDGWAVAAVDDAGNAVSIYAWDAATDSFQVTGSIATGNLPVRIAAADFTGDGLDDLVVANDFDNSVTIAFQQPDGTFSTVTRTVGEAPSDITFANLGGQYGPDIVVSDQVSGDFTVLFNDAGHGFLQQSRYRAGSGLFDIIVDPSTGAQSILSQLQTVGVLAGDFTGSGSDDLVLVNRGAHTFTLLPTQGGGIFTDPQPGNTYFTSAEASQAASLTLSGDTLPSVAILMEDLGQIWIYRNQGNGTFAAPIMIDAGNDPTSFSVATVRGQLALLVGNSYGDILTLLYDGDGSFAADRANLQNASLAVGTVASTGQQYAVVADQDLNQVSVYYRKAGTDQFDSPVPINSQSQPLLAPGAVQLFTVPGDPDPYLVVANSLSNNILVYHSNGAGGFDPPTSYPVGFDPVSITVADLNGDGIPDLAVANEGSNDVSILIGAVDPTTGAWTATPYQRLNSGGSGPLAIAVENTGSPNGPSLLVTNSDGKVVLLPGIGSDGKGSGFFQDTSPETIDLGSPIVSSSFDAATGQLFVVRADGGLSILNGDQFTSLFFGQGVTALDAVGPLIVAGFADGSVGLLSGSGALLESEATGFADELSALQVLQDGDVYVTERGAEEPVIVSFASIAVVPELPPTEPVAEATGPVGPELFVIATLVPGGLAETAPADRPEAAPVEETFSLFAPSAPVQVVGLAAPIVDLVGEPGTAAVLPPVTAPLPPSGRAAEFLVGAPGADVADAAAPVQTAGWEGDTLGATEALRARLQGQRAQDRLEDVLDLFLEGIDQLQRLLQRPAREPAMPGAQPPSTAPMRSSAVTPEGGNSDGGGWWFACEELAPMTAGRSLPSAAYLPQVTDPPDLEQAPQHLQSVDESASVSPSLAAAVFAAGLFTLAELPDRATIRPDPARKTAQDTTGQGQDGSRPHVR